MTLILGAHGNRVQVSADCLKDAIATCVRKGQCQSVVQLFPLVFDKQLPFDQDILNLLLYAAWSVRNWEMVSKVFHLVQTAGLRICLADVSLPIEAATNKCAWELALMLFDDMHTDGATPDAAMRKLVSDICVRAGQSKLAMQMLDAGKAGQMCSYPSEQTVAYEAAPQKIEEGIAAERSDTPQNKRHFAVRSGMHTAEWQQALLQIENFRMTSIMLNASEDESTPEGSGHSSPRGDSQRLQEKQELQASSVAAFKYRDEITTYAEAEQWAAALQTLLEMSSMSIEPDHDICNTVVEACVSAGQHDVALCILEAMQEGWEFGCAGEVPDQKNVFRQLIAEMY